MAKELGKVMTVYIDNASSTALALPGQIVGTLNYATDALDSTDKTNSGFRAATAGLTQITIDFEGHYDHSDTAMTRVLALVDAGSPSVNGEIQRDSSTYKSFSGVLESFEVSHSVGELATYTGTIVVSGALS